MLQMNQIEELNIRVTDYNKHLLLYQFNQYQFFVKLKDETITADNFYNSFLKKESINIASYEINDSSDSDIQNIKKLINTIIIKNIRRLDDELKKRI